MKRRTFLQRLAVAGLAVSTAALAIREAVADLCSKVTSHQRRMRLPPLPKWSKATDDIDSRDFARRWQDYERSLLPRDLVFPRAGQIWEAVRDCELPVRAMVGPSDPARWAKTRLRQGQRVRILELDHPKPLGIRFRPLAGVNSGESIASESLHDELWLRTACTVPVSDDKALYFTEVFRLVEEVV